MLGFKGSDWHTHGDLLVPAHGQSAIAAAMSLFDFIVSDKQPIHFQPSTGETWLSSDLEQDPVFNDVPSTVIIRLWSGKAVDHVAGA